MPPSFSIATLWPVAHVHSPFPRRYQKSTELLIRKLPFQRLVREIAQDFKVGTCDQQPWSLVT